MGKSWTEEFSQYQQIATDIEPASRLVTKDSMYWDTLWWFAVVFTLGIFAAFMSKKKFLGEFATTLFPIQGYPAAWSALSTRLLVHECRHTTHCVWLGYLVPVVGWIPGDKGRFIRAWCGAPFYVIIYLFLLLPVLFATGRFITELDCELTAWRWQLQNGYKPDEIQGRAAMFSSKLCGPPYLFAVPSCIGKKIFKHAARKAICKYG
jgi:hypothetical protein